MASLIFHARDTCPLCRCRVQALSVGTYRINQNSLVATSPALMAFDPKCRECGFPLSWPECWAPDQDSADVIAAARAKRGWS